MTNKINSVLYTGLTFNLVKRAWEHKNKLTDGFTKKYNINKLVYFEVFEDIMSAGIREKRIKRWKRAWKIMLVEKTNPQWEDLYETIIA